MPKMSFAVFALLLMAVAFASVVHGAVIDPAVESALAEHEVVSVIVLLKPADKSLDATINEAVSHDTKAQQLEHARQVSARAQVQVLASLSLSSDMFVHGGEDNCKPNYDFELERQFSVLKGFAGKLTASGLKKLRNNPQVVGIYADEVLHTMLNDSVPQINANDVWNLTINGVAINGSGETVCVIDTGINYSHPALGGCTDASFLAGTCAKVLTGYDFVNNDNNPIDDQGHGTHVAGIVASEDSVYRGVAPGARLVAMKACNNATPTASCNSLNIASALDWCINNSVAYNITIVSMSLGSGAYNSTTQSTCDATSLGLTISEAKSAGIISVASSGNSGSSAGIAWPACCSNATSVGAVNKTDGIWVGSQSADILDLLAPGVSIVSANLSNSAFVSKTGTSMAAPHVSGVAALLRQYKRVAESVNMTPDQIESRLKATGVSISDSRNGLTFPRINIFAALAPAIGYALPTPENNTTVNISVIINITSNDTLSSALLEWDGANESMAAGATLFEWNTTKAYARGAHTFKVWANDTGGLWSQTGLRNVIMDFAPSVDWYSPNVSTSVAENSTIDFNHTSSDADADALSYYWLKNGTLVNTSANWTWAPNFTDAGVYNITLIVSDGLINASQSVVITVNNTNRAPVISDFAPTNVTPQIAEPENLTFIINYTDPDGDALNVTWYQNGSAVGNTTGGTTSNWTFLGNYTSAGAHNITAVVSDGNLTAGQTWILGVNNTNIAPTFDQALVNQTANEGQTLLYDINCTDEDGAAVAYYDNTSLFDINSTTGLINDTPAEADVGNWTVLVTCSDGSLNASQTFVYAISNVAPVVVAIPNITANQSQAWSYDVNSTDDTDNLTWSDNTTLFVINATSGVINDTPTEAESGVYSVNVTATDAWGANGSAVFIYTIVDNVPPSVLNVTPAAGAAYNQSDAINITANVTDGKAVGAVRANVSWSGSSTVVTMTDDDADGVYNATFTNTTLQAIYNVTILANDSSGNNNNTQTTWFNITDGIPPNITGASPTNGSTLAVGTTATTIRFNTSEIAVCRYNTTSTGWANMTNLTATNNTAHNLSVSGLSSGITYDYYFICHDTPGNEGSLYLLRFSVAAVTCGDAVCSSGETCSSCAADCGACPPSGGGGGGGGTPVPTADVRHTWDSIEAGAAMVMAVDNAKVAATELGFTLNATQRSAAVSISARSSQPAEVSAPQGAPYQYLIVDNNIAEANIASASLRFKVNMSWIAGLGKASSSIALLRWQNGSWSKMSTTLISEEAGWAYYEAVLPGLSYFVISALEEVSVPEVVAPVAPVVPTNETSEALPAAKPEAEQTAEAPACPQSCDDGNACSRDWCGESTNWTCAHAKIEPCCGNGLCEASELCVADCTSLPIALALFPLFSVAAIVFLLL